MSDSLTRYPNGIFATPMIGASRLIQMFESNNIWFVDADDGKAGNLANEPDLAEVLVSSAEDKASAYGTIYVKPRVSSTGADVNYSDNIVIPVTKTGLAIIGAGNPLPGYRGVAAITGLSTTTHIIDVQAPNCTIENLQLNDNFTSEASIINCVRNATYPAAVGLQVRGCRLLNADYCGSDGTSVSGAIGLGTCQYSLFENNLFLDCLGGIVVHATYGSPQSIVIRNNLFTGLVAQRDDDIWFGMSDINSRGHVIMGNVFADGLPTGGSRNRFIENVSANANTGIICGNYFAMNDGTYKTDGSAVKAATGLFLVGNYQEHTDTLEEAGDFATRSS